MFHLEINDPIEAKTFISQNLVCQVTGIVYEVEEFRLKLVGQSKNVSSAVRTIHIKDVRIEKQENQSVPIVRGHILCHTKGVPIRETGIQATCG